MIPRSAVFAPSGAAVLCLLFVLGACADAPPAAVPEARTPQPSATEATVPAATRPELIFLGTSLTAAYGLDPSLGYPARIQEFVDSAGLAYEVVNAGVSGETSATARRRLSWLLRERTPAVLVIETGANDGLRGLDPDTLRANLEAMVAEVQALPTPPKLLLVGMQALPNLGAAYAQRFAAVYRDVAAQRNVPLLPFLLVGVAGVDSLNQPDGVHPTAAGQRVVAKTVWSAVEPLLR